MFFIYNITELKAKIDSVNVINNPMSTYLSSMSSQTFSSSTHVTTVSKEFGSYQIIIW